MRGTGNGRSPTGSGGDYGQLGGRTQRRPWARCTEKPGWALSSGVAARTKRDCTSTSTGDRRGKHGGASRMDSDGQPAITRRQGGCYAPRDPSRESIQGTLSEMSRDDHRRHTGRAVSRGTLNDTHRRNNVEIGTPTPVLQSATRRYRRVFRK